MASARPYAQVQITKQAYWRGQQHLFQNAYWISGNPGASDMAAVIAELQSIENAVFPTVGGGIGVGFVRAKGYSPGTGPALVEVDYNESESPGTATGFTGPPFPAYYSLNWTNTLEVCLEVVTPLSGTSSRGKPVSNRKYFRGFGATVAEDQRVTPIDARDLAVIAATCLPWKTGMTPSNYVVIGKSGRQASGVPTAQNFLGNHQVPRGRKKKVSSSASSSFEAILGDAAHIATLASIFAE
jgi:hypothetical protein